MLLRKNLARSIFTCARCQQSERNHNHLVCDCAPALKAQGAHRRRLHPPSGINPVRTHLSNCQVQPCIAPSKLLVDRPTLSSTQMIGHHCIYRKCAIQQTPLACEANRLSSDHSPNWATSRPAPCHNLELLVRSLLLSYSMTAVTNALCLQLLTRRRHSLCRQASW